MATLNSLASNTIMRKKRDLESTMNTLKKLLEPTISCGTRKKNKPRSLAKILPKRTISRIENVDSSEDGEYYPNLKKKNRTKKIVLKPKHELKVVVATNKRKRGTPHKGLESLDEEEKQNEPIAFKNALSDSKEPLPDSKELIDSINPSTDSRNQLIDSRNQLTDSRNQLTDSRNQLTDSKEPEPLIDLNGPAIKGGSIPDLKVHTSPISSNTTMYELVSPPHKSLTSLTVDDLMRMDEDSLSSDDFMEVLTCPSPVWWEEPPDDIKEDKLITPFGIWIKKRSLYLIKTTDDSPAETKNQENSILNPNPSNVGSKLKRSNIVTGKKARKIAKLENILGNIKTRARIDAINKNIFNNKDEDDDKFSKNHNDNGNRFLNYDGNKVRGDDATINTKYRYVSSSCSEISVNEDDLLRNLENIEIPIRDKDVHNDLNDENKNINDKNDVQDDVLIINIPNNELDESCDDSVKRNNSVDTTGNKRRNIRVKCITELKQNLSETESAIAKDDESVSNHNSIDQSQNDDILDVRLIQTPTNRSNEVKIWSQLDNFKRHNFNLDFNEVIDVENEIERTIIHAIDRKKRNAPADTILIDDDSNDAKTKTNEPIQNTMRFNEFAEITLKENNDVTNENTIKICNLLDIRLIENSDVNNVSKPERRKQNFKSNRVSNSLLISNNIQKNEIRILPRPTPLTMSAEDIAIAKKLNTFLILPKPSNAKITVQDIKPKEIPIKTIYTTCINKSSDDKNIILKKDTKSTENTIRINDVDITLVKNPGMIKDDIKENPIKNDLSITLINNESASFNVNIAPMVLPTLTKNPKPIFESPKSLKSPTSESNIEFSEGTISDTNVHFLDEYDDKHIDECIVVSDVRSLNIPDTKNNETTFDMNSERKLFPDLNETEVNRIDENVCGRGDIAILDSADKDLHEDSDQNEDEVTILDEETCLQDTDKNEDSATELDDVDLNSIKDEVEDNAKDDVNENTCDIEDNEDTIVDSENKNE